jgi:hypothetical protein
VTSAVTHAAAGAVRYCSAAYADAPADRFSCTVRYVGCRPAVLTQPCNPAVALPAPCTGHPPVSASALLPDTPALLLDTTGPPVEDRTAVAALTPPVALMVNAGPPAASKLHDAMTAGGTAVGDGVVVGDGDGGVYT